MASLKFLFVACALVLAQAHAHPQVGDNSVIMDIIKWLVPKADDLLEKIIDASSKAFDEAAKDPEAYQVKSVEKLDASLEKSLNWINDILDKIKAKGNRNTAKIIDCVEGAKEPSKALVLGFYDRTTKCMAPDTKELMQKLSDIQPDIRKMKDEAFKAAYKVEDCDGDRRKQAQCLATVVEDVLDSLRHTSGDVIQKAIDIVLTIVNKLEDHIPKCAKPNVERGWKEAIETVDVIADCALA